MLYFCSQSSMHHPAFTMEQLVKASQMIGNKKEADFWSAKLSEIEE